jgi:hypothetical protein
MLVEGKNHPIQTKQLMEKGVEYVGIINKHGRIDDAIFKNDLNLSKEKYEIFFMGLSLQQSMQKEFDEELGPISHTVIVREGKKFAAIPAHSHTILVVMNKTAKYSQIIYKIKKIMKTERKFFW